MYSNLMDGLFLPRVILLAAATVLSQGPRDNESTRSSLLGFGLMQVLHEGGMQISAAKYIHPRRHRGDSTWTRISSLRLLLHAMSVEFNVGRIHCRIAQRQLQADPFTRHY